MIYFYHHNCLRQTRDNTALILQPMWGDGKESVYLLFLGLDVFSPLRYQWMKATPQEHIWMHKEVNKYQTIDAQKSRSSSKRPVPNIPDINYADGSIVCCCLLLQIIDIFKDMVGGGSCRLSFCSASSNFPVFTCVTVAVRF